MIHTFGDSNAIYPWNSIHLDDASINCHQLVDKTCASFGMDKIDVFNIKNYGVEEGDIVCFIFGMIDCTSNNIGKNKEIYKEITNRIIENYFATIKINVEQYKNLTIIIECVQPVVKDGSCKQVAGTDIDRRKYTEYFNFKLKKACEEYKYLFLNTYKKYCGPDRFMNDSLRDVNLHIGNPEFLIAEFINILK